MRGSLTTCDGFNSAYGTPNTVDYLMLSDDPDTQVAQTIEIMRQYAEADSTSPQVAAEARDALMQGNGDAIAGVWAYVKSRMRFVNDGERAASYDGVPVVEEIVRPRDMSTWNIGDCDDYSTYAASLLTNLHVPVSFVTVAADAAAPNDYSHVYLAAYPNGVRTPLDLSHGAVIGWETPNLYGKRREWPVGGSGEAGASAVVGLLAVAGLLLWSRKAA